MARSPHSAYYLPTTFLRTCTSKQVTRQWTLFAFRLGLYLVLGAFGIGNILLATLGPPIPFGSEMHVAMILILLVELLVTLTIGLLVLFGGEVRQAILTSKEGNPQHDGIGLASASKMCVRIADVLFSALFLCAYFGLLLLEFITATWKGFLPNLKTYLCVCSIVNVAAVFIRSIPLGLITSLTEITITYCENQGRFVVVHGKARAGGPTEVSPLINEGGEQLVLDHDQSAAISRSRKKTYSMSTSTAPRREKVTIEVKGDGDDSLVAPQFKMIATGDDGYAFEIDEA